ncbi:hypothetical protein [Gemmobacter denitrificans]|uniref:Antifreeze protein n=1 Tax=Gemmobacter denitrificans TaxID=3123040 RepID=A0ABU8C152_9RHOB
MIVTPAQALRLSLEAGQMVSEAQIVIAMRLWGMAGLWNTRPDETVRMVQEKVEAMAQSSIDAGHAMMTGKGVAGIAMAAMKPVRQKTSANVRRLTKAGSR